MRLQYVRSVTRWLYEMGEAGAGIRQAIIALQRNPKPTEARALTDRPGVYELFVDGYWVVYQVDESDPAETVITILLIEEN